MGIARNEINVSSDGLDQKGTNDSLQHIYDQLQMIDHVLELRVDRAILDSFQSANQNMNNAMIVKNRLRSTIK
ncbi:hypothetical protein VBD025_11615 [Virgibacillus flavescens]|uniref:hypothetical protein n=1 Tax=Virgibacillus flavescens TaxID=1611422 RepID=UPI003D357AC2